MYDTDYLCSCNGSYTALVIEGTVKPPNWATLWLERKAHLEKLKDAMGIWGMGRHGLETYNTE